MHRITCNQRRCNPQNIDAVKISHIDSQHNNKIMTLPRSSSLDGLPPPPIARPRHGKPNRVFNNHPRRLSTAFLPLS